MTGRSGMAAMIFNSAAQQLGQCCMSMSKTRLSSRAQLMRLARPGAVSLSVLKGRVQPSGYTELLLYAWRLKVKANSAR